MSDNHGDGTGARREVRTTVHAARIHRWQLLQAALAGTAAGAVGFRVSPVRGQAKKFAGVSISGASFQSAHHEYLKGYLPEFEAETGMKVDFQQQAFPTTTSAWISSFRPRARLMILPI